MLVFAGRYVIMFGSRVASRPAGTQRVLSDVAVVIGIGVIPLTSFCRIRTPRRVGVTLCRIGKHVIH